MANLVLVKRSNTAAKVPLPSDLTLGELAINTTDGKIYMAKDDGTKSVVWINSVKINGVTNNVFTFTYSDFSAASNTLGNVSVVDILARGVASGLAPIASPTFIGTPAAPTTSTSDNSTKLATTAFVQSIAALKSPLESPTFTGVPAAPTASYGANTTQLATTAFVQTEISGKIAALDVMVFKGVIDCSANPNYPAADTGHTYRVSVAGKIGGGSGINVEQNDTLICLTDGSLSGTQASVGSSWAIIQGNIDGAVTSVESSSADNDFVVFAGTSGKSVRKTTKNNFKTLLGISTKFISDVNDDIVLSSGGLDSGTQSTVKVRGAKTTTTNTRGADLKITAPNGTIGSGNIVFETSKTDVLDITSGTPDGAVSASSNTITKELTIAAGLNRYLVVTVVGNGSNKASTVTYAGAGMTLLEEVTSTVKTMQLWGLVNPNTGSNNIVANFDSVSSVVVYGTAFYNVDQSTPISLKEKASSSTGVTSAGITIATTPDQIVYDAICTVSTAPTITNGQSQLWAASGGGNEFGAASKKLAISSSTSVSYTFSLSSYTYIAVAFNRVASSIQSSLETSLEVKNHGVLAKGLDLSPRLITAATTETLSANAEHLNIFSVATTDSNITLPNATKLSIGTSYTFMNRQSTGNVIVKNNAGTTLATVNPLYVYELKLVSNTTIAGTWITLSYVTGDIVGASAGNGVASLVDGKVPESQLPPAQTGGVTSWNGQSGVVTAAVILYDQSQTLNSTQQTQAKSNVGLGNVSNLAPANMPISTAVQVALDAIWAIGDYKTSSQTADHSKWLLCNGALKSRSTYSNLFLTLCPSLGTATVTIASPAVITLNNHGLIAGDKISFETTGSLPTGTSVGTNYYVSPTGLTANSFQISTTDGGASVNTSGTQSGVHTLRKTPFGCGNGSTTFALPDSRGRALAAIGQGVGLTNRPLGQVIGTESHTLSISEIPSHSHSVQGYVRTDYDINDAFSNYNGLDTGGSAYSTTSVGGGGSHNNMQPTLFLGNVFIYAGV